MTLIRSAEVQNSGQAEGDGRTVDVRLVPWETPQPVTDDGRHRYLESFARGSLEVDPLRQVPVYAWHRPRGDGTLEHGPLIGHLAEFNGRAADAAYGRARIADIAAGRDTLALVDNGTVRNVSIEFDPIEDEPTEGGVIRARARLAGLAFTHVPQHQEAEVLAVRSDPEDQQMTFTPPTPFGAPPAVPAAGAAPVVDPPAAPAAAEVAASDQEGARARAHDDALHQLSQPAPAPVPAQPATLVRVEHELVAPNFRSLAEYVSGYVARTPEALEVGDRLARALATSLTTDNTGVVRDAWINEIIGLIAAGRPFINTFRTRPLPDSGMNVNYPKVAANVTVGEQDPELEEVASSSFQIDPATWPVETFAGGERISLQLALRSDPSYLEALWRAFALEYAVQTDKNAIAKAFAATTQTSTVSADTAAAWYAAIVDACMQVWVGSLMRATAIVMSVECWAEVAKFVDGDGRPIFPTGVNNPANAAGQTDVTGDTSQIGGLTWVVDPNMTSRQAIVGTREAFTHLEQPGAPIRLQQEQVSVLGRDAAVYGFVAEVTGYPAGMCEVIPPAGAPA